jgi:hypothetical protein
MAITSRTLRTAEDYNEYMKKKLPGRSSRICARLQKGLGGFGIIPEPPHSIFGNGMDGEDSAHDRLLFERCSWFKLDHESIQKYHREIQILCANKQFRSKDQSHQSLRLANAGERWNCLGY